MSVSTRPTFSCCSVSSASAELALRARDSRNGAALCLRSTDAVHRRPRVHARISRFGNRGARIPSIGSAAHMKHGPLYSVCSGQAGSTNKFEGVSSGTNSGAGYSRQARHPGVRRGESQQHRRHAAKPRRSADWARNGAAVRTADANFDQSARRPLRPSTGAAGAAVWRPDFALGAFSRHTHELAGRFVRSPSRQAWNIRRLACSSSARTMM